VGWLNDVKMGEHLPCFTAAILHISQTIRQGRNELIVRVGAHPGVLPLSVSAGTNFEKIRWAPGIYDRVSVALGDNPFIETVQVAPKVADSAIVAQSALRNFGKESVSLDLTQRVHAWKADVAVATSKPLHVTLAPGRTAITLRKVRMTRWKIIPMSFRPWPTVVRHLT